MVLYLSIFTVILHFGFLTLLFFLSEGKPENLPMKLTFWPIYTVQFYLFSKYKNNPQHYEMLWHKQKILQFLYFYLSYNCVADLMLDI